MAWTLPITRVVGDAVIAGDWNTYVGGNSNWLFGDPSWQSFVFVNSWAVGGTGQPGYRLVGPRVYLRGQVSGGASNTTMATLPPGYWPTSTVNQLVSEPGAAGTPPVAFGIYIVGETGAVDLYGGFSTGTVISLDGVSFDAAV